MTRNATNQVTTIGIYIGRNKFHLIGLDGAENIVLRRSNCLECPFSDQQADLARGHGKRLLMADLSRWWRMTG